jgi:hypothetical protein
MKFGGAFGFGSSNNYKSSANNSRLGYDSGNYQQSRLGRGQKAPRELMTKMEPREVRPNDLYSTSHLKSTLPQSGISYRQNEDNFYKTHGKKDHANAMMKLYKD